MYLYKTVKEKKNNNRLQLLSIACVVLTIRLTIIDAHNVCGKFMWYISKLNCISIFRCLF